jgi:hypothetical protein
MSESKPIPVRLNDAIIARLDSTATRLGTNRAALIRFCLTGFLEHFEAEGHIASLPLNWRQILSGLDRRTSLSRVNCIGRKKRKPKK